MKHLVEIQFELIKYQIMEYKKFNNTVSVEVSETITQWMYENNIQYEPVSELLIENWDWQIDGIYYSFNKNLRDIDYRIKIMIDYEWEYVI